MYHLLDHAVSFILLDQFVLLAIPNTEILISVRGVCPPFAHAQ